jgi:hypothetical protein
VQLPLSLVTPPLRLTEGEELLRAEGGLRHHDGAGASGNRYGELWVTTRRVAFIEAVLRDSPPGVLAEARPLFWFERATLRGAAKVRHRRHVVLELSGHGRTEHVALDEAAIDGLIALLRPPRRRPH